MMRPATIFLGQRRRGDGLARAEEGSGEESARASAFFFEKIGGYSFCINNFSKAIATPSSATEGATMSALFFNSSEPFSIAIL